MPAFILGSALSATLATAFGLSMWKWKVSSWIAAVGLGYVEGGPLLWIGIIIGSSIVTAGLILVLFKVFKVKKIKK